MEGKTHYVGGSIGAIVGFITLKETGMLLDNIHPILQFSIIYPFGIYGGMLPDADHHPESSPLKDPVGRVFNRALHVFNKPYKRMDELLNEGQKRNNLLYKLLKILKCSHRSWQTHSELTIAFLVFILYSLFQLDINDPNVSILALMVTGLTLGILSHLVLDMLTCEGIYFAIGYFIKVLFPKVPMIKTIRLVPDWHTFTTGSPYELNIRASLNALPFFALAYVVVLLFGYELVFI